MQLIYKLMRYRTARSTDDSRALLAGKGAGTSSSCLSVRPRFFALHDVAAEDEAASWLMGSSSVDFFPRPLAFRVMA